MTAKSFLKWFGLSLIVQLLLLLVVSPLLSSQVQSGKKLPTFLISVVYAPFILAVIRIGGYSGETSMIWPPVYGVVLGIATYSLLVGLFGGLLVALRGRLNG